MGLYLYCLAGPDHPRPDGVDGLEDAPVVTRRSAGFEAWVSELAAPPSATLDRVRRHNDVVEAAARVQTPLPVRFGQWFETAEAMERSLDERAGDLRAGLDRIAGAVEMAVRVTDPSHESETPDRASGTAYLEALARREKRSAAARDRAQALALELKEWLGPLVREERVRAIGGETLVSVAHLVDRHDTGNYRGRAAEFWPRHPELRFTLSGPWPPYGFVE